MSDIKKLVITVNGTEFKKEFKFNPFELDNLKQNGIEVEFIEDSTPVKDDDDEGIDSLHPDYLILHNSKYINDDDVKLLDCSIQWFSHIKNSPIAPFFKKIQENELTISDVEEFFNPQLNTALNILHQIYNGQPLSKIKELDNSEFIKGEKYNALENLLESGNVFKNNNEAHLDALDNFRNEVLQLTLNS